MHLFEVVVNLLIHKQFATAKFLLMIYETSDRFLAFSSKSIVNLLYLIFAVAQRPVITKEKYHSIISHYNKNLNKDSKNTLNRFEATFWPVKNNPFSSNPMMSMIQEMINPPLKGRK